MEWPTRKVETRRRRLPHWTAEEGTYFATFRLRDALSGDLLRRIATRRRPYALTERFLDRGKGSCYLRDVRIAGIVDRALRAFDGSRYLLHAWVIMPNHVHVAFRLFKGVALDRVLHSWKGATAFEANKLLQRSGVFWQKETYDSLLHDQNDLNRVIHYIVCNPIRASLTDWPWTTVLRPDFVPPDRDGGAR